MVDTPPKVIQIQTVQDGKATRLIALFEDGQMAAGLLDGSRVEWKPHAKGWLRQALGRSGVDGLGMHRLRASFATLQLRNKTNPKDVQEMLGHRYIHTTMKYSEGSMESKRKAQEELWA